MKKFEVITTMTNEKELLNNMTEVNEHIKREIAWFNSPRENEKNSGYSKDDFIINEIPKL